MWCRCRFRCRVHKVRMVHDAVCLVYDAGVAHDAHFSRVHMVHGVHMIRVIILWPEYGVQKPDMEYWGRSILRMVEDG